MIKVTCPRCDQEYPLSEARNDEDWRTFCQLLTQTPQQIQAPLLKYLDLFKPLKHSNIRSSRMRTLLVELLPLIKAQSIERNHRQYTVSYASWAGAMEHLAESRNTLQLPLKGNGYLLTMLANHIEKREASAEAAQISKLRKQAPSNTTPQTDENRRQKIIDVQGQLMHSKTGLARSDDGASSAYWTSEIARYEAELKTLTTG